MFRFPEQQNMDAESIQLSIDVLDKCICHDDPKAYAREVFREMLFGSIESCISCLVLPIVGLVMSVVAYFYDAEIGKQLAAGILVEDSTVEAVYMWGTIGNFCLTFGLFCDAAVIVGMETVRMYWREKKDHYTEMLNKV